MLQELLSHMHKKVSHGSILGKKKDRKGMCFITIYVYFLKDLFIINV